MAGTEILPEDQKIFSIQQLKEKGFSQYKVSKLVNEGCRAMLEALREDLK
ncbi:MAG: hypothetical protein K5744_06595 [Eubacterium sp.]|nr:hypothetical protein [Eubacterium sp.]